MNETTPNPDESPLDASEQSKAVSVLLSGLNWAYRQALNGGIGFDSAEAMAESYSKNAAGVEEAIDRLIAWHIGQAAATGFVTNVGGLITLPAAIPANLAGVILIQLRMVAAIAHLRGHDITSHQVKTFALACLAGSSTIDLLKGAGIQVTSRLTSKVLMSVSGNTLIRINQMVGFRLVTKAGTTGIVNLSRIVPFVGGLVGGTIDAVMTKAIATAAKRVFPLAQAGTGSSKSDAET